MMEKRTPDPQAVAIGRRVRLTRLERGMTLERLAEAADTTIQFLSKIEKGEQQMTMVKFGKLATALNVSADYLLFGSKDLSDPVGLAAETLGRLSPVEQRTMSWIIFRLGELLDNLQPENHPQEPKA